MCIGLTRGTVALEPHSSIWEKSAKELINKLKETLKDDIVAAEHIGSTSILNIYAKPIVDIVVGVTIFDRIMKHNDVLMAEGIIYRREDHPGQLLYICGDLEKNIHTHYIHVVIWGEKEWNNYINMRDYLNSHEDKAKEYSELKLRLAKDYPNDRIAYTDAKSDFIENILQEALEWRKSC
ncbi:MAG: GrpB family protein [Lachnospiraceae bacterium]|nr:GrpB family protein [Lachnospiraceae bacterium]